jgi:hypothetical protein
MHVRGGVRDSAGSRKLKQEEELASKPLNKNSVGIAMHKKDINKSTMKHLLNT